MSFLGIFLPKAKLPSAAMPPHLETLPCTGLPMPISTHATQSLPKAKVGVWEAYYSIPQK